MVKSFLLSLHDKTLFLGLSTQLGRLKLACVHEGIWVCESDNLTSLQSFPSIDQAIIIREPFEGSWFTILAEANQPQWKWIFEGAQPKTQVLTICTMYCGIPKVVSLLWEMLIYICLYRHQLLLVYHDMLIYIFDVFFTNQFVLHSIHIHFHFAACIGLARFGQALYICDLSMLNLSCPWAFLPISCRWLDVNPPFYPNWLLFRCFWGPKTFQIVVCSSLLIKNMNYHLTGVNDNPLSSLLPFYAGEGHSPSTLLLLLSLPVQIKNSRHERES